MGLGLRYGRLDDAVVQLCIDEPYIVERAAATRDAIIAAISEQTGSPLDYPDEGTPPNGVDAGYVGSYSTIHLLRMFAARYAGLTLDEAYELDLPSVSSDGVGATAGVDADDVDWKEGNDSVEDDFEAFYGIPINEVIPPASEKASPFPYYNLVCFSDAEGIYVPASFEAPIVLDDYYYIGSAHQLLAELDSLRPHLDDVMASEPDATSPIGSYYQTISGVLDTLRNACALAVENLISVEFV